MLGGRDVLLLPDALDHAVPAVERDEADAGEDGDGAEAAGGEVALGKAGGLAFRSKLSDCCSTRSFLSLLSSSSRLQSKSNAPPRPPVAPLPLQSCDRHLPPPAHSPPTPDKAHLELHSLIPPLGRHILRHDGRPVPSFLGVLLCVGRPIPSLLRQLDNWRRVGQSIGGSVMLGVRSVVGERSIEECVVVARARSLASFCLGSELWSWSLVMIVADAVVSFAWRAGWWGGLCKGDAREMGDGGG